jgi:hypothetical protein
MIHTLKTWTQSFEEIVSNNKRFEIRKNDRDFRVGDRLDLMEYDPTTDTYTGSHCHRWVTYIMRNDNPFLELGDKVIMSLTNHEI